MADNEKIAVNHYLYLLLIQCVCYEFEGFTADLPSNHEISEFIYQNLITSGVSQKVAKGQKNYIRTEMIPVRDFRFYKYRLDVLVRQITKLGTFYNWDGFVNHFRFDLGVRLTDENIGKHLSESDFDTIRKWAKKKVEILDRDLTFQDQNNKPLVISIGKKFVIRTANYPEFTENILYRAEQLFDAKFREPFFSVMSLYGRSWMKIENFYRKKEVYRSNFHELYKRNKYSFFVYRNSFGVMGTLVLLPLKSTVYDDIVDGTVDYNCLKPIHIHSIDEIDKVSHLHIYTFNSLIETVLVRFKEVFQRMVRSLVSNSEVKITIVARNRDEVKKLEKYKFVKKIDLKNYAETFVKHTMYGLDDGFIEPLYEKVIDLSSEES